MEAAAKSMNPIADIFSICSLSRSTVDLTGLRIVFSISTSRGSLPSASATARQHRRCTSVPTPIWY